MKIELFHTATREALADSTLAREALRALGCGEVAQVARKLGWDRARAEGALRDLRGGGLARRDDALWSLTALGREAL